MNKPYAEPFHEKEISITLTGEEWFCLMVQINNGFKALSKSGREGFKRACEKIKTEIEKAS